VATAEGGTLVLDEIGDLPIALQPKLLRFLQSREYEAVGDPRTRRADVRLVATTNRDLEQAIAAGAFREDLYYRLNVIRLEVPALADRPEDILPLARSFLDFFSRRYARPNLRLTVDADAALRGHRWPGNVRELRNAVERAALLAPGEAIGASHLGLAGGDVRAPQAVGLGAPVSLADVEAEHLRRVLSWAKSYREAAEVLGIDEATLWRKRKQLGL
jgi:NtrC-family two-component system response regulator AlgB